MGKSYQKPDEIYRKILPTVEQVTVFPNIAASSKYNPYLSLLYKECPIPSYSAHPFNPIYIFKKKRTVVHYNWLECKNLRGIVVLLIKLLPLFLFMKIGGKVVWTVHNTNPHHGKLPKLNRWIRSLFAKQCSAIIVHSSQAGEVVQKQFSLDIKKIFLMKHPHYDVTIIEKTEANERLSKLITVPPKQMFLMYGYIAPYKGIDEIIPLFKEISATLIIAGKIKDSSYFDKLKAAASTIENVQFIPRFITTEEEQALFSLAQGVIFNFKNILTSGSLLLAGSYKTQIFTKPLPTAIPEEFKVTTFSSLDDLSQKLGEVSA